MWVNPSFAEEIQLSRSRRVLKNERPDLCSCNYFFYKSHSVCQESSARCSRGAREQQPRTFLSHVTKIVTQIPGAAEAPDLFRDALYPFCKQTMLRRRR